MSRLLNGFPYSVRRTVYAVTDKKHPASASGARNEALRALVRAISETDHEGVQRQTALALGLPPSTLNWFMNGANGASIAIVDALKAYLRRSEDDLVAANGDLTALRSPRPAPSSSTEVRFDKLPMWSQLLEGARSLDPSIPAWVWRDVAETTVWVRVPVTSSMVLDIARFLLKHLPPHT